MTVSVFVGTSVDGFIARRNGDFDFLPPGGGEPHGYDEFMAGIDALVLGRKTLETVLTLAAWLFGSEERRYKWKNHPLKSLPAIDFRGCG
jgi:dihydrofolate reductase